MPHRNNSFGEGAACAAMAICGSIFLNACSSVPAPSQPVRHVVLIWMKNPERAEDRGQLIRAAHSLRMMPGVSRVEVGHSIPAPPPGADRSYHLGVVITFRDRATLERYEEDPRHQSMVRRYLGALVRRYQVYDLDGR